ncbi:methyl-CpG-binding domain-containing protein 2-like [Trifolium repens]|nr:methyl-CpG-binding domain-containing protein 2-like [Trifolium repens]
MASVHTVHLLSGQLVLIFWDGGTCRGEGCSKFADIYYVAPSGKKLRSKVEVKKFLADHPEYVDTDVRPKWFSFHIPKPLLNLKRKRSHMLNLLNRSKDGELTAKVVIGLEFNCC